MSESFFTHETEVGLQIRRRRTRVSQPGAAIEALATALDSRRGAVLTSGFEYPGRYTRFDVGFVDPPLCLTGRDRAFRVEALNRRGQVLLSMCSAALSACPAVSNLSQQGSAIKGQVASSAVPFTEEERTRQPSLVSILRCLREAMACPGDPHLGFYGALGYDLVFQFESLRKRLARAEDHSDLVLMLPDELTVIDHQREVAWTYRYEFSFEGRATEGLPRATRQWKYRPAVEPATPVSDHGAGGYAEVVRRALREFEAGNLFEVVPGQEFQRGCPLSPSRVFGRLRQDNPAPYGFMVNLGEGEYLVGASPEMFVRVQGGRVETCPIAGTIARGADALGDADQILKLLSCPKEKAELTMCTDVDRNDKARVCKPGSVRVIGRRQVELYSRLIHTVDHVVGELREGFDALDALLSHAWAVTVTGAPKQAAMQFIEDHELSPRRFYGGAVGMVGLDGSINTGLTLRTMHIRDGVAHIRAGATLLHASDPETEAGESELKASALLAALDQLEAGAGGTQAGSHRGEGARSRRLRRLLLVDHRDSFVHTLGDYFRQLGARVDTLRAGFPLEEIDRLDPDLVVLSPGPGRPQDFAMERTLSYLAAAGRPAFGVCLGLQGLVEFCGGQLGVLPGPRHGSQSMLRDVYGPMFEGLPSTGLTVGRYHSLHALPESLPSVLQVHAQADDDGCVMACAHRDLPFLAVQFHPESIMSAQHRLGLSLLDNVLTSLVPSGG
ncbi:MAG: anthranilate synthase component I [Myxococcales bacterium]|nr:anthranilate synthase component I [Myxococcales bacterium]